MYALLQRLTEDVMRNIGCAVLSNYLILYKSRPLIVRLKNKPASELFSRLVQNNDFNWEDNYSLRTFPNFYGAI